MNQIIDLSDVSSGSHLDLFTSNEQEEIIKNLSLLKGLSHSDYNTTIYDSIIDKDEYSIFNLKTISLILYFV
jgi:hypothetical protein